MYITQYENETISAMNETEYEAYMADLENFSLVPMRQKKNPANHWAVPFVTGHSYYYRFEYGLDFESIAVNRINWLWGEDDLDVHMYTNHYDVREAVYVDTNQGKRISNNTIGGELNIPQLEMGDNLILNDTETRLIHYIINGRNYDIQQLTLTGVRCVSNCQEAIEDEELELTERYWSNASHWGDFGRVPEEGDDVVIESSWNMIYDLEDSPRFTSIEVRGKLTFLNNGTDRHISAYNFWVRSGTLEIGTRFEPFTANARITLLGDNTEEYFAFTNAIEAGNKNLVVTGTVNMFGAERSTKARLMETMYVGDKESYVTAGLDWQPGDVVVLAPTNMRTMDWDELTIETYDSDSGKITFTEECESFHYGTWDDDTEKYGVDMRAEVALTNRTIVIDASTDDINSILKEPWGCRILVSDFFEADLKYRKGSLNMDHVQVYNCSQKYTYKSAIKFENAVSAGSEVTNSFIGQGKGIGIMIKNSQQISLKGNVVADMVEHGIWAENSNDILIDDNWVLRVIDNASEKPSFKKYKGFKGGITASDGIKSATVTNNRVAGTWHHGFHFVP